MPRRTLDWSAALRDLKSDRLTLSPVREERIRATSGLSPLQNAVLSAWRGHSSRRYVVTVDRIAAFDPADFTDAVVLFVGRDLEDRAAIIVGARDLDPSGAAHLAERAFNLGATEVHIHRLADTAAERAALLADLQAPVLEDA